MGISIFAGMMFMSRYDKALNADCTMNGYRLVPLDELMENSARFRQEQQCSEREKQQLCEPPIESFQNL